MPSFEIDGIKLKIPSDCLNDNIVSGLRSGHYEAKEAAALKQHVRPGDRVLELGGGAGYLAILASQITGSANVMTVEASPRMSEAIQANALANDAMDLRMLQGAVVPDSHKSNRVAFEERPGFWASKLAKEGRAANKSAKLVKVPAFCFSDLQSAFRPTVVVMDVEGAEADLAKCYWLPEVRIAIMETHPNFYDAHALRQIFLDMFEKGFGYMPWGSRGNVVVFERLNAG